MKLGLSDMLTASQGTVEVVNGVVVATVVTEMEDAISYNMCGKFHYFNERSNT